MQLLERDTAMSALTRALTLGRTSGQLVAVSGEAGIGKSSLLRACAADTARQARWYWGYCEALDAPRPLGPLLDIAPELGGAAQAALAGGSARHEVFTAFLSDLADAGDEVRGDRVARGVDGRSTRPRSSCPRRPCRARGG